METSRGRFCSYSLGGAGAGCCVLLLHGGGYSALTWSLLAKELGALADCALVAVDLRGHGETEVLDPICNCCNIVTLGRVNFCQTSKHVG